MTIESLRGASYPQNRAKEIAGGVLGFVTIAKRKVVEEIVPKALKATKDVATLVAGAKAGGVIAELLTRAQTQMQYSPDSNLLSLQEVKNAALNPSIPGFSHLSTIVERMGWLPAGVSSSVENAIEQKDPSYLKYIPEHIGEDLVNIGHSVGEFLGWSASVMLADFALAQITSAVATNEKTPNWLRKDLVDNSSYLAPWSELTTRQKFVRTTNAIALGSIVDAYLLTSQYSDPICKFVECG